MIWELAPTAPWEKARYLRVVCEVNAIALALKYMKNRHITVQNGGNEMPEITMADCKKLYERFKKYTETAEQHEFPILMQIDFRLQHTMATWKDPINQTEAAAMFRVVEKYIGKEN